MSAGPVRNPLHRIVDLLTMYQRTLLMVHQADTAEKRATALDSLRACHPAVWKHCSSRNIAIRRLADPAKAWLTQTNSRFVGPADLDLVEECAVTLSGFAIGRPPMSMPDIYSKNYHTEDELWQTWEKQGEMVWQLDYLIARLQELSARAGELWTPPTSNNEGCAADRDQSGARQGEGGKGERPRGRKSDTDPKADKRVADAMRVGHYRTYAECAKALGMTPREVERAIDRDRKRRPPPE